MNLKKVHLKIVGRVQGVFYRASLQQQAKALGITGWCRNMPDGSVEAVVAGDSEAVQALIDWCWQGPSGAEVRDVQVQNEVSSAYEMPECAFEVYR
jgi:acylphosphatase